jgi:hypothetical protein
MQRSRIDQIFNVPQRVRLGLSLAAALLDDLFEDPVGFCPVVLGARNGGSSTCPFHCVGWKKG